MSSLLLKLVDGDASATSRIRGLLTSSGDQLFSVYDFMTVVCVYKDAGNSARKEFKRLTQDGSEFQNEVAASCRYLKFPGSGQRDTPCMTIRGLQRLLMILGGKVAAEFRKLVEGTFTRVMAGDQSLIEVINANASSQEPVQQAYRQALAQEPVALVLDDYCLKRKRELEDLELMERRLAIARNEAEVQAAQITNREREVTLQERMMVLDERKLNHKTKLIEHVNTSMGSINALKDWANVDERTKLQAEDHIKNLLFNKITQGQPDAEEGQFTAALNVSVLAKELGFTCNDKQLIQIGRAMAAKYRSIYGEDPPKHKQFVNGNFVPVNSYMERDRSVMEQVIRECMHVVVQTS